MVEHCRDTLRLGSVRIPCGVGHCRDTLRLGTAGIFCAVGHRRDMLPLNTAVRLRVEGEDNIEPSG